MKIFGKRKSSSKEGSVEKTKLESDSNVSGAEQSATDTAKPNDTPGSSDNENVASYFSQPSSSTIAGGSATKTKKQKRDSSTTYNGDDMDILLDMEPSKLNSKQRRLVKRHRQREGGTDNNDAKASSGEEKPGDLTEKDGAAKNINKTKPSPQSKDMETTPNNDKKAEPATVSKKASEILAKLEGLNSKDRRKLLRQLRRDNPDDENDIDGVEKGLIAAAEEEARRVADRNRSLAEDHDGQTKGGTKEVANSNKRKANDAEIATETTTPKKKNTRKKKNAVNLEDLPPDERKRREEQRKMQQEAAERREKGLVDPNRHPLNSERRRANRRKPSRAALIAMEKKAKIAEKGQYNAVGYQMRRNKSES